MRNVTIYDTRTDSCSRVEVKGLDATYNNENYFITQCGHNKVVALVVFGTMPYLIEFVKKTGTFTVLYDFREEEIAKKKLAEESQI